MTKCFYKFCRFGNEIKDSEKVVTKNRKKYHENCYHEKMDFQSIQKVWKSGIDENVNSRQLQRVASGLIKNGYSATRILFTLEFCILNKKNLNYPPGLRYFMEDSDIVKAWDKKLARQRIGELDFKKIKFAHPTTIIQPPRKEPMGFERILKKGIRI